MSELSSRCALLQWAPPLLLSESSSNDSHEFEISENDLRYEVLLSDKSKEMKYKSIYNGASLSCRIQDLRPGQEYSACVQVHLDEFQGSASDPLKFVTPPCEPDQPQPPKLLSRTKNSLQLRWNAVNDNGSHIQCYVLEYDDGKGGEFMELHKSRGKQHTLQKLQPATMYKFRLAAMNDVGKSLYSDVVTYSTSDIAPLQPNPPSLKEASVNSLHLSWAKRPKDDEFVLKMDDPKTGYGFLVVYNGKDTEHIQGNLHHFKEYRFKLLAQNDGGQSDWSEVVTFKTLPDRPCNPSKPIVKGRIHAHSFKLKWEQPVNTGGAEITQYILEVNSGSGYEIIYTGKETEAVCDNLTPGTTYQLRVSCISAGGHSNYSDPCTVTTDAVSPGQCASPRLVGKAKSNSITVRWAAPDYNGGAPVLEYELEMESPDSAPLLVHKSKETECTVTDLRPGCNYTFKVRAINRIGAGSWSDSVTVTSGAAPPGQPEPPITTCKSPFHVAVEWQEPVTNGAPITEYRLEMSPSDSEDQFLSVFQGLALSHDVKGLTPFTAYYFRIQACNNAGYGPHSGVAATITPAAAPAPVPIPKYKSTPTSITLYWNEPASNGSSVTHYNIEIGEHLLTTDGPINEYTIESLNPDTLYKIKIQAVNSVGAGLFSSTLKALTARLPPTAPRLECIGVGHNYLKLKWADGKTQDYNIQYYVEKEDNRSKEFQNVYKGRGYMCKVNKLQELTTYRFRISAFSEQAGAGEYSKVYEFTTSIAPPPGLKAPKAVEIDQKSCVLEWTSCKPVFSDPVVYLLQMARVKDQEFKQVNFVVFFSRHIFTLL